MGSHLLTITSPVFLDHGLGLGSYLQVPLISHLLGPNGEDLTVFRPVWVGCKRAIFG